MNEALSRLTQGRTNFTITHDLTTSVGADCILSIESGRILERGSSSELMRTNGHYARHYTLQARALQHPDVNHPNAGREAHYAMG